MKIQILSDLHNEFSVFNPPECKVDLVVLAGDIDLGAKGAEWALKAFKKTPIIYVVGNHEYYGNKIPPINDQLSELSEQNSEFYFLENESIILNGIRFLGCALWSDFQLLGPENFDFACICAEQYISDFFRIRLGKSDSYRELRAIDVIGFHKQSIAFLEENLSVEFSGKTVIVTHHAPLFDSVPERFRSDVLSCAFASHLDTLIKKYKPELWIHGHTHFNVDYIFDETRIISNQRGYYPMELIEDFNESLVIDIIRRSR